jgi:hypothetical protein
VNAEEGMTVEEAEQIIMAAEVGMFYGTRSELAHALIAVAAAPAPSSKEE